MNAEINKTIVVTGGTKGIGKAIIEAFMEEGFSVCTCSRNMEELDELKSTLELKYPGQIVNVMKADLSDKSACIAFGSFVHTVFNKIDVLVNNTGFFTPGQLLDEADGALEVMINTNLYSAYHISRFLLPSMVDAKTGHLFNLCSIASITPYKNGGSYSISKYAMFGMTKVLREEMKEHNVRVTAILPGATLTSSWEGVNLPGSRFMKPSDVGQAVFSCWKLSDHTVVEELLLRPQLGDI